ncbi:N-acetyltransferase 5 [Cryptotrichosporon argae]
MAKPTAATLGTVSSPLDLAPKGEHEAVSISARGRIRPKPKVTLTSLTPNNAGTLRKINSVVIPVVYSDKFYKDVLDPALDDVNKIIYFADIPVGAICCRFDGLGPKDKGEPTLNILTLAVLAPYRSYGLGHALVRHALSACLHPTSPPVPTPSKDAPATRAQLTPAPPRKVVARALVHVQAGNDGAKRFYERLGFKQAGVEKDYYSKAEPKDAIVMVLDDIAAALGEA